MRSRRFFQAVWACVFLCMPVTAWSASAPEPMTVNRIVAVVNGEMISSYDLELASAPDLMKARIDPRDPRNAQQVKEVMREALERMIADIIVVQEAERLKISAPERDVNNELENMAKRASLSVDELIEQLGQQGMKPDHVRDRVRKRILQQRLLSNMVGRKVVVSKDEVAQRFAELGNAYVLPGQVRFAVLVYAPQAPAEEFAKGIKKGLISFEEAVKRASVGPRRAEGGHLAMMPENEVAQPLRPHLEGVEVGAVSEIFVLDGMKTQIKMLERVPGKRLTTFEEAAPHVEDSLRQPRLEQRYKEYLDQLRKKAIVDIRFDA